MRNAWSFIQMENPVTLGKVEGEIVSSQNLSLGRILTWCNLFLWIGTGHRVFSPLYWTLAISSFSSSLRYSHSPLFQLPPLLSLPPQHTHLLTPWLLGISGQNWKKKVEDKERISPTWDYRQSPAKIMKWTRVGPGTFLWGQLSTNPRLSYKGDSTLLSVEALGEENQCLHN